MLSVSEACERIQAGIRPVESQTVLLDHAAGRVLAFDILATTDLPIFDNSSVDGFALSQADISGSRTLAVVADIRAGENSASPIKSGETARIMTGAPVPPGAEAVVKLEDTDFKISIPGESAPRTLTLFNPVQPGENIRYRGNDLHAGDTVLKVGARLRAQDIGLLAMLGIAQVSVHRKPRLALLSSGDELIPVDATLTPGKVHESNSYALAVLAEETGVELIRLGVSRDSEIDIRSHLERAVDEKADVIVSSAGVSVGAYDYVKSVIEENGELDFWKVDMRPGKPLAFGTYQGIPFFGLPGNPVSAFIGFKVFVEPALEKMSGQKIRSHPHNIARLVEALETDGRESYLCAVVNQENGSIIAHLTGHQGSGDFFSLVRANALLIVPSGVKSLPANSDVEIWPIT
jgi:molybdopterin molybdotransferase